VKTSANTAREPKPSTPAAPSKQERRPEAAGTPKPDVAGSAADARAPGSAADTDTTLGSETGTYWVQVGAFRDPDTAKRVAAKLQEQRFRVEEMTIAGSSTPAASPGSAAEGAGDRYDVFVASGAPADVVTKLTSKGLSAEAVTDGAIVKPSLPLRDAVALSKDLASEGFKVQVKRARTAVAGAPASSTRAATGEAALHRVRVGAFADRAAAAAAMKKLEALGYTTFLARGGK
jgi:cell division septation protein DedD